MKAILVIDMPKKCTDCELSEIYMGYLECCAKGTQILTDIKPEWCPLKPMLQKMKADYDTISSAEVTKKVVAIGWNACVEAILGEEE